MKRETRGWLWISVGLVLLTSISTLARAQEARPPRSLLPAVQKLRMVRLLTDEGVQRELELSDSQAQKVRELVDAGMKALRALDKNKDGYRQRRKQIRDENLAAMNQTLTTQQRDRLDNVRSQLAAQTLLDPQVAARLKLSDEQVGEIQAAVDMFMKIVDKEALQKCFGVLTDSQMNEFTGLLPRHSLNFDKVEFTLK